MTNFKRLRKQEFMKNMFFIYLKCEPESSADPKGYVAMLLSGVDIIGEKVRSQT